VFTTQVVIYPGSPPGLPRASPTSIGGNSCSDGDPSDKSPRFVTTNVASVSLDGVAGEIGTGSDRRSLWTASSWSTRSVMSRTAPPDPGAHREESSHLPILASLGNDVVMQYGTLVVDAQILIAKRGLAALRSC
jgi:hypothetical protein